MRLALAALLLFPTLVLPQAPPAQSNTTVDGRLAPLLDNLGTLHVPISSSNPNTQTYFNQGMRLIYGFNHAEALRSFREAARTDPNCAMAFWGQALALSPNINDSAIGPDREQQGYDAIRQALQPGRRLNPKERDLIDALSRRFSEKPPVSDRKKLNVAYANAMRRVWSRYPSDPDVAVLFADAVMNTRPWDYWTKNSKPQPGIARARLALERTIQNHPDHPGARHLYIHLLEASDHVDLAVPSADRLGALMPGAGHLVHMPSHIYIRTGRYIDAAAANRKAILADENYISQCRAQGIYPAAYYPHNIHFLNAALVMQGRSAESLASANKAASTHGHHIPDEGLRGFIYILQALPTLTMVRFGQWDQIASRQAPPADHHFLQSIHFFATGLAHSARGDASKAQQSLDSAQKHAADPSLRDIRVLDLNPVSQIAAIGVEMLRGDIALKARRFDDAAAAFRKAVQLEDSLLYSEPPEWPIPPRQYLAHSYLMAGNTKEAERVYREDLKRHRDNGWSLIGLEECLRKQNRSAEADKVHSAFQKAWQDADIRITASRF